VALTLSAEFQREVVKSGASPVWLVNIGGLANGKLVKADRNVLGYPKSVVSINPRSASIDPVSCQVSLSELVIEFIDDGIVRALAKNNYLLGKTLTTSLGFDTQNDATFPEGSFAPFHAGLIDSIETEAGIVRIKCRDFRTVLWERRGSTTVLPVAAAAGQLQGYYYSGPAVSAMADMLSTAGIPSSLYDATSFATGNCPATGYMNVDRYRMPQDTNAKAVTDRRLLKPTPVKDLLENIARVLRGYIIVQEDGLIRYKEFNNAASPSDRFTNNDIIPGTFRLSSPTEKLVTSVVARTLWEGLSDNGGPGYRLSIFDSSSTDQTNWGFTGGTKWSASETIEDDWFGVGLGDYNRNGVGSGDTTITVATGGGASPITLADGTHPGYLYVVGYGSADTGEIIKYTSVTTVIAGEVYTLGGLTRGMFGTTTATHSGTAPAVAGSAAIGCTIYEVTGPIRAAEKLINRFSNGYPIVEFRTPMHKYGVQLGDTVYLETPIYLRYGVDGLAVGQTTYAFEVIVMDVDPEALEISWKLLETTESANARVVTPTQTGNLTGAGNTPAGPIGTVGSILASLGSTNLTGPALTGIIRGTAAPTSANLTHTIPSQIAATTIGPISLADTSHTYTASKDTYVDLCPMAFGRSKYEFTEVASGAAAPALAAGRVRCFKVSTSGSAITSVTDLRAGSSGMLTKNMSLSFQPNTLVTATAYAALFDETSTNYCTNPSFEVDTSGWTAAGTATISRDTTAGKFFWGAAAMKVAFGATPATTDGVVFANIAAAPGDLWTGTAFLLTDQAAGRDITFKVEFLNAGLGVIQTNSWTWTIKNSYVRVLGGQDLPVAAAPANTAWVRWSFYYSAGAGPFNLWIDGAQFEKNAQPTSYLDGDMGPSYSWSGTAHASTSSRTAGLHLVRNLDPTASPAYLDVYGNAVVPKISAWGQYYPLKGVSMGLTPGSNIPGLYIEGLAADLNLSIAPQGNGAVLLGNYSAGQMRARGAGSSFPATATTNDLWFRTDQGILYYYDGTRWLSVNEYNLSMGAWGVLPNGISASGTLPLLAACPYSPSGHVYLTKWTVARQTATTNNGTNFWTINLLNNAGTNISNFTTASDGINWITGSNSPGSDRAVATDMYWYVQVLKTLSPGNLSLAATLSYRLIGL